jgi:hypothetical protein
MQFLCCYNGLDGWPSTAVKNKEQSRRMAGAKGKETVAINQNTNDFVPSRGCHAAGIVDTMAPCHHD